MKRKIIALCIGLFFIIIAFFLKYQFHSSGYHYPIHVSGGDDFVYLSHDGKPLIEYSYSNYAWVPTNYGEVIFEDGIIYAFDCDDKVDINISDCLTKKIRTVSNQDLKLLKDLGKQLKNSIQRKNTANDFGEILISYYLDHQKVILAGVGDNEYTNSSVASSEILKILKKYGFYL